MNISHRSIFDKYPFLFLDLMGMKTYMIRIAHDQIFFDIGIRVGVTAFKVHHKVGIRLKREQMFIIRDVDQNLIGEGSRAAIIQQLQKEQRNLLSAVFSDLFLRKLYIRKPTVDKRISDLDPKSSENLFTVIPA